MTPRTLARAAMLAATVSLTCASPLAAQAQAVPEPVPAPLTWTGTPRPGDRSFITAMLQESRGQIAFAQLASRRATGYVANSAAELTEDEWTTLRAHLIPLAYAAGAPVRGTLDAQQRAELDALGRTPASQFDRAYLADLRRANQAALERMGHESTTTDQRLLQFISYAEPLVESYQQMATDDQRERNYRD